MNVIFIILPPTILIAIVFVIAFALATRRGQFDDTKTPSLRILFKDDE